MAIGFHRFDFPDFLTDRASFADVFGALNTSNRVGHVNGSCAKGLALLQFVLEHNRPGWNRFLGCWASGFLSKTLVPLGSAAGVGVLPDLLVELVGAGFVGLALGLAAVRVVGLVCAGLVLD